MYYGMTENASGGDNIGVERIHHMKEYHTLMRNLAGVSPC